MALSGRKRGITICIDGDLRSINLEKNIASVNIEKSGQAIDPYGTLNRIFKKSPIVEPTDFRFLYPKI